MGRLTTVAVGTTGRLRVVGIRINRVEIAVRFVEAKYILLIITFLLSDTSKWLKNYFVVLAVQ